MKVGDERGFMLLEVLVAAVLTIGVILAVTTAVLANVHATTLAEERIRMSDDGLNAIADLRAITGYDGGMLRGLIGKHSTSTVDSDGLPETIIIDFTSQQLAIGSATSTVVANITIERDGQTVTEQQSLVQQAPPPGSTVTPTPEPAPHS